MQLFAINFCLTWYAYLHLSSNLNQPMNHDVTEENMILVLCYGFVSNFLILMRLVPFDVIFTTEFGKLVTAR